MSRTVVRVNMAELSVTSGDVPPEYELLGGRALTSRIVNDEVPALCHPLRRHNKIVFAPGLLSGTTAPSSSLALRARSAPNRPAILPQPVSEFK